MNSTNAPSGAPGVSALSRPCILVVEDEFLIRMTLSDAIRDAGYGVIEACNADEAQVIMKLQEPDAVISDVRMPGSLDGIGLLASIRATSATMPVIIMSAHLQAAQALAEGATHFVEKPFSLEMIVRLIETEIGGAP